MDMTTDLMPACYPSPSRAALLAGVWPRQRDGHHRQLYGGGGAGACPLCVSRPAGARLPAHAAHCCGAPPPGGGARAAGEAPRSMGSRAVAGPAGVSTHSRGGLAVYAPALRLYTAGSPAVPCLQSGGAAVIPLPPRLHVTTSLGIYFYPQRIQNKLLVPCPAPPVLRRRCALLRGGPTRLCAITASRSPTSLCAC